MIDLRSDTVTQPTDAMRAAMAKAEVGDDVFREDPTVNQLQDLAAKKMGKDAGLFVPSGTMGNLLAVLAHCQRGDEVIMGNLGHTFLFEGGGISALGGIFVHTCHNTEDGTIDLNEIIQAIRPDDIHQPRTRLLILENTHNRRGGAVIPVKFMQEAGEAAHSHGLAIHLDGARIFNAAISLGVDACDLATPADSITFCLSKGLCAPVGSVLCGSEDFIEKSRRLRKMLGGAMRQAGILAAAGIVALETMVDRLGEDHQRARALAEGLGQIEEIKLEHIPASNMVFASLNSSSKKTGEEIRDLLLLKDIKVGLIGPNNFRMVTHYWIKDTDIDTTVQEFKNCFC